MSYFMTISEDLSAGDFSPVEFLPISKGQRYIANLEAELYLADGAPVWLAHDWPDWDESGFCERSTEPLL